MRLAGITVALAIYWLTGVVGAASLPPDDQYSPQPSPYRRDVAQGPRGFPNWLQYRQDPSMKFEPPKNKPGTTTLKAHDPSWGSKTQKDSTIFDGHRFPASFETLNIPTAGVTYNVTDHADSNLDIPEESDITSASRENIFVADDAFQDQGPGSVEVYKLDLLRENALLLPEAKRKQQLLEVSRMKSKIPKKANVEEILWKLKPIEASKSMLPMILRQPSRFHRVEASPQETNPEINENRKDEVFAVGGVPELQVGCEGLEASERQKRSSSPSEKNSDRDLENWQDTKNPVYAQSTDSISSQVTPIVIQYEEDPPNDEIYEEMDELLKLRNLKKTSPTPKPKSRGDIDPAFHDYDDIMDFEQSPERGDLGSVGNGKSKAKRSISLESSQDDEVKRAEYRRESGVKDDALSPIAGSRSENSKFHGGRKLLWLRYPESQNQDNQVKTRHHQAPNDYQNEDDDLWGFGEGEGVISGSEDESEAEELRKLEMEKRRRENERRREEEMRRRHGGHRPHSHERHPPNTDANSEIERIRLEHERRVEEERRERQRIEYEIRNRENRRHREEENRRTEEVNRRREEEAIRRMDEEDEGNHRDPPSSLTRPEPTHHSDNRSKSREEDPEERKLREYVERNRPIDPKHRDDRRNDDEERRRHIEEERRRQHMEELRRRQQQPDEEARRRQMEEHRRRQQPNEEEQRRQMEEQRRRQQPNEEERRRQMEEQRRRPQQPNEEERRRQMEEQRRRPQHDEENRRRQMEEQRRQQLLDEEERRRQMEDQRRRQQVDEEERRRQMEEQRRKQQHHEEEKRRQMEEQHRRDRPDNRAVEEERRRRLEEERKLLDYVRRNQPINVPRRNSSDIRAAQEEQRRTLEAARQYENNKVMPSRTNEGRSHGPSAPTNIDHRHSASELDREEQQRRERVDSERRRLEDEERRREEEYRRAESRRREEERRRLEAMRRNEENRRPQSEVRRPTWHDSGSRRPGNTPHKGSVNGEVHDWEAEELRRRGAAERTSGNSMRNQEDEWRRRSEERDRQRHNQEERERLRMENERNSRNNGRRRPQHEDIGLKNRQRGETFDEKRRREHARLSQLPVSARIVIRANNGSRPTGLSWVTTPTPSIDSRNNFGNDIDFPVINPHRPGPPARRFPAPATRRPPAKSPGACVWAIVQCCPANNRLTTCFESMGCPGVNWDPNPCRGSLADAARAEVVRFYEAAEADRTKS